MIYSLILNRTERNRAKSNQTAITSTCTNTIFVLCPRSKFLFTQDACKTHQLFGSTSHYDLPFYPCPISKHAMVISLIIHKMYFLYCTNIEWKCLGKYSKFIRYQIHNFLTCIVHFISTPSHFEAVIITTKILEKHGTFTIFIKVGRGPFFIFKKKKAAGMGSRYVNI